MTHRKSQGPPKTDWHTPKDIAEGIKWLIWVYYERKLILDPCSDMKNTLGFEKFYTKEDNGLDPDKRWWDAFVNPPGYGTKEITPWLEKAWNEYCRNHILSAFLIPANTGTEWFYRFQPHSDQYFIRNRIDFKDDNGKPIKGNTLDSMILVIPGSGVSKVIRLGGLRVLPTEDRPPLPVPQTSSSS